VDRLLMAARAEFDDAKRNALFASATETAMADQPTIPLYHDHNIWAFGPNLAAFRPHPRGWTTAMQATR
jgi:peptide/nickel transport system substrate-binding protein